MIIIFGLRRLRKMMGPILLRCNNCGASPLALFRVSTWFALFFIPLIPVSFRHYTACPNCKRVEEITKDDVERARSHEASLGAMGEPITATEPATLEHAVNQWATSDAASSTPALESALPPTPAATGSLPPPGWYIDPTGSGMQRYWDGTQWTASTAPASS
jgi:hypothetical protein